MRSSVLRRCAAAAISMGLWTTSSGALAQAPNAHLSQGGTVPDGGSSPVHSRPAAPAGSQSVDVSIVAGGEDAAPLMDTLRELVGRLGLETHPHVMGAPGADAGAAPPPGLSVEVDLGSRYEAVVIVRSGRTEIRRSIPRDGSPAVVREEIGEAVRSTVESQLLSDEARSPAAPAAVVAAPPPAPVTTEAPRPAAPPTGWFALDITTLAGIEQVADGSGLVPHIGGGAVVGSRRGRRPSLTATGAYLVPFNTPFETSLGTLTAHTTIVALRAIAALELWRLAGFAVDVGAGGGLDIVSIDASANATAPSMTTEFRRQPSTRVDPVLTAVATGYAALTPGVALTLVAGVEWDLTPPQYVVDVVGGPGGGNLLAPWRVRPVVLAGFTFTALGGGLFSGRGP
jgi:hypothetical protein